MATYYVNKVTDLQGDHEVHNEYCNWLPSSENRQYLGVFSSCEKAVKKAKEYYTQVNGCYYCSKDCHTS